ncbi:MAG: GNAT family N-acetyltransferase [Rhizobiaceae bacterium]|nr:GNAT family N-acetyltransferase [Rhizobiaceae bacterium]
MAGYFGTEAQQRLQAQAEASVDFITSTPGACQNGRMMGCDDPERLGWDRIDAFLDRDGACGFRLIEAGKVDEIKSQLLDRAYRLDTWDVFVADQKAATAACEAILSRRLPDDLAELVLPTDPLGEPVKRAQALMGTAGIVPFSGSFLTGSCGPAKTVALGNGAKDVVAAAHCYMPHNAYSPFQSYAWGGLVAVAENLRGNGLGNFINARMIISAFRDLGATHIYELVSATNTASRRMVEACGLRLEPALVCGAATPARQERFTR